MNRKSHFLAVILTVLLVLSGLSPVVNSKEITKNQDKITIQVNQYTAEGINNFLTELNVEDARELQEYLEKLHEAIDKNDQKEISKYEFLINEKGIFGEKYQDIYSKYQNQKIKLIAKNPFYNDKLNSLSEDDNISNSMCSFYASGEGIMIFTFGVKLGESILEKISNASSFMEQLVLLLALLPIYVLVMLFTHAIPFRIALPIGIIQMKNGKISTRGTEGYKTVYVEDQTVNVNISWFTGITISIPSFSEEDNSAGLLFVSGFCLQAEQII
jgi:hypothetical protein